MKTSKLALALAALMLAGGSAWAADCCIDMICCEEPAPCCP